MILPYKHFQPKLEEGAWVAPNATVIGDVHLGRDVSIWFGTVVRGDVHRISIGDRTNIQDNSVVHITRHKGLERQDSDGFPTLIGSDVTIGHRVVIHGCRIEDDCLIGMGAVVLDGAIIGRGSLVGAGSVVTPKKVFPPGSLILGSPARLVRTLSDEEIARYGKTAANYVTLKDEYGEGGVGEPL